MVVLTVAELLEPGIREILEDWDVASSYPDSDDWLKWQEVEVIVVQYEIAPSYIEKLSQVAPVVVITCFTSYSVEASCLQRGASRVVHISSYATELLDAVDKAIEGSPLVAPVDTNNLSPRERDVLRLMADARYLEVREIAEELGIGGKYAYNVAHRLYVKLGVSGAGMGKCRQAAVDVARERRWI